MSETTDKVVKDLVTYGRVKTGAWSIFFIIVAIIFIIIAIAAFSSGQNTNGWIFLVIGVVIILIAVGRVYFSQKYAAYAISNV
jgi:bacteriorhodopsin